LLEAPTAARGRAVFVTADTHFDDDGARTKFARPFASLDAMNDAMLAALDERVGPRDVLLHLGDVFGDLEWTRTAKDRARRLRDRIASRRIVLVRGNLDPVGERWFDGLFEEIHDLVTWKTRDDAEPNERIRVVACHYPLRQWQGRPGGAVHLYGHVHGGLPEEGRSTDVGVDCWSFAPQPLDAVISMLAARPKPDPTNWPRRQDMREKA
jgi:calcineurin-like phosphoesterase family protein